MKKFLVILMVLAMASVLLVGCVPTPTPTNVGPVFTSTPGTTATVGTVYSYTPTATDADADTVTFTVAGITGMTISTAGVITWTPTTAQIGAHTAVVTASDGTDATAQSVTITVSASVTPAVSSTPILTAVETSLGVAIFDVLGTGTLYMNKAEVGASILVKGTGPSESQIRVYLGDLAVSTYAETAVTGLWTIAVAKSSLGADGVKVLTAKCTEVGLAESAASNSVTFTLDTVLPSATTLAATADAILGLASGTAVHTLGGTALNATLGIGVLVTDATKVVTGTWIINVLGISGELNNVTFTEPGGTVHTYTKVGVNQVFLAASPIPGVKVIFSALLAAGQQSKVVCLAQSAAIADRARVLFSEAITNASAIAAANYTFTVAGAANVPTPLSYSAKYMYFSPFATALVLNSTLGCSVNGVVDLAGNIQTTASALTCTVAAADLTALKP